MNQVQVTGLAWYEPESFQEVRAFMKDGNRLSRSYAEWHRQAEALEKKLRGEGTLVVRAVIRPVEFQAWCNANGQDVDAKGRMAFANWVAIQKYRSNG